jgi:acyl carrier protein
VLTSSQSQPAPAALKERIRRVIGDHARLSGHVESLADSACLADAGMTSHANVMVMLALENEFSLEFPDYMLSRRVFESVDTIAAAVTVLQNSINV